MHDEDHYQNGEPVQLPINGTLDLHTFNPHDVRELLPHYLDECRKRGIFEIRIIHGKGTGTLRKTVHSILERLSGIASYKRAEGDAGGWGATLVTLKTE